MPGQTEHFFPLNPEAVQRGLELVKRHPCATNKYGVRLILSRWGNSLLSTFLKTRQNRVPSQDGYWEGVGWAGTLVDQQHAMTQRPIPVVNEQALAVYRGADTDTLSPRELLAALDITAQQWINMDYEVKKAMADLLKYRMQKTSLRIGFADVYGPLRHSEQLPEGYDPVYI